MKGIILAAGEGRRLRPLTEDKPKSMIEFCGMTLLQRQVNVMKECDINDIIVITGYKSDIIDISGVTYYKNEEFEETNMVETLFCAKEELEGEIIVSYADIIYERNVLQKLIDSKQKISVVIDEKWEKYWNKRFEDPLNDVESLKINSKGNIIDIGQKTRSLEEIQGQYIGLMKFDSEGTKIISDFYHRCKEESKNGSNILNSKIEFKKSYLTDLLQGLIVDGNELKAVFVNGGWLEFDTINDFNLYQKMIKDNNLSELINFEK